MRCGKPPCRCCPLRCSGVTTPAPSRRAPLAGGLMRGPAMGRVFLYAHLTNYLSRKMRICQVRLPPVPQKFNGCQWIGSRLAVQSVRRIAFVQDCALRGSRLEIAKRAEMALILIRQALYGAQARDSFVSSGKHTSAIVSSAICQISLAHHASSPRISPYCFISNCEAGCGPLR